MIRKYLKLASANDEIAQDCWKKLLEALEILQRYGLDEMVINSIPIAKFI